ncbi:MAG: hypothetical protein EPN85_10330 [Bacteroidetes bacterium]|nr:MAG: hypothetical protein EPN85_10330 [Bacteroidota bacterium]
MKTHLLTLAIAGSIACYSQEDTLSVLSSNADTVRVHVEPYHNPMLRAGAVTSGGVKAYSYIDGFVDGLDIWGEKGKDIETLSHLLTDSFNTDGEKVRAIFYWMTQNIDYDVKKYHNRKCVPFRCYCKSKHGRNKKEHRDCIEKWEWELAREALIKRKGVCSDYAFLFYYLCDFAEIECRYITGFASSLTTDGRMLTPTMSEKASNHAWNAVMIEGEWHLLDVTWASGYCDKGVNKFTRELSEDYYLTPPEEMIFNHHPKDKEWQLLDRPLKMKEFVELVNKRQRANFVCSRSAK